MLSGFLAGLVSGVVSTLVCMALGWKYLLRPYLESMRIQIEESAKLREHLIRQELGDQLNELGQSVEQLLSQVEELNLQPKPEIIIWHGESLCPTGDGRRCRISPANSESHGLCMFCEREVRRRPESYG